MDVNIATLGVGFGSILIGLLTIWHNRGFKNQEKIEQQLDKIRNQIRDKEEEFIDHSKSEFLRIDKRIKDIEDTQRRCKYHSSERMTKAIELINRKFKYYNSMATKNLDIYRDYLIQYPDILANLICATNITHDCRNDVLSEEIFNFKRETLFMLRKLELLSPSARVQEQALLYFRGNDRYKNDEIVKYIKDLHKNNKIHKNNDTHVLLLTS